MEKGISTEKQLFYHKCTSPRYGLQPISGIGLINIYESTVPPE